MRSAFTATATDQTFLTEAEKQQLELDPMDWREMTEVIERIYTTPKPVVEATIEAMQRVDR